MKRRKAFDREYRLMQIVNALAHKCRRGIEPVTASEVSHWLEVSSVQARTLLNHLVAQNVLVTQNEPYPGVCGKRTLYQFSPDYLRDVEEKKYRTEPPRKRTIKINGQQLLIEVQ